jgi:CRP-like cAMP-binding protein
MTLVEKTVFLKSVDVLAQVPTEALAQLAARAVEARRVRGDILFREGDEDQGLFMVVEGELELRKAGLVVRRLTEGMTHGELFLGEGQETHQYTAMTRRDALLLNLPRAEVMDALLEYPEIGVAMVKELSQRLHKVTQRLIHVEAELKQRGSAAPTAPGEPVEPPAPATEPPAPRGWWRRRKPRATLPPRSKPATR